VHDLREPGRGHPTWSLDEEDSRRLITQALEACINFFDTAHSYSQRSTEEILDRALHDYDRDDVEGLRGLTLAGAVERSTVTARWSAFRSGMSR
jgi:predicted aldo/keto reductase-like oxidoreductase